MKFLIYRFMLLILFVVLFHITIYSGVFANPYVKAYHPDGYELDDSPENAAQFTLGTISPQIHNFHKQGDEDWIQFYAVKSDMAYTVNTYDLGENCETRILIFEQDGMTQIDPNIDNDYDPSYSGPDAVSYPFRPTKDGTYYVRITHRDFSIFGDGTSYSLMISHDIGPETGYIEGLVTNFESGNPIGGAVVQTNHTSDVSSFISFGYYMIPCLVGDFTVTARKTGYETFSKVVTVGEASRVELYIALTPSYAYNSTYEVIQWLKRGSDTYYCIDICDLAGNAYPGLDNLVCAEDMNAWSPKQYININLGIPDSALSGFQFMWKIRSFSGYGGEGFEGCVTVP